MNWPLQTAEVKLFKYSTVCCEQAKQVSRHQWLHCISIHSWWKRTGTLKGRQTKTVVLDLGYRRRQATSSQFTATCVSWVEISTPNIRFVLWVLFIIRYSTSWKRYRGSLLGVKFNKISVALNKIFHKKSTSNWLYISSLGFKHFLPKSLSQNIVDTKLRYRHWTPNGRFNSFGWLNPQFVWRGYKILILLFTFTVQSL